MLIRLAASNSRDWSKSTSTRIRSRIDPSTRTPNWTSGLSCGMTFGLQPTPKSSSHGSKRVQSPPSSMRLRTLRARSAYSVTNRPPSMPGVTARVGGARGESERSPERPSSATRARRTQSAIGSTSSTGGGPRAPRPPAGRPRRPPGPASPTGMRRSPRTTWGSSGAAANPTRTARAGRSRSKRRIVSAFAAALSDRAAPAPHAATGSGGPAWARPPAPASTGPARATRRTARRRLTGSSLRGRTDRRARV